MAQPAISPGAHIGRYVLESGVGRSGTGEIWNASDPGGERRVELLLFGLPEDPAERDELRGELRRRAALEHPSLPPIYDAGEDGGYAWLARRRLGDLDPKSVGALTSSQRDLMRRELASALAVLADARLAPAELGLEDIRLDEGRAHLISTDATGGGDAAPALADLDRLLSDHAGTTRGRRRVAAAGVGLAVVVALAVALFVVLRGGDEATPGPAGRVVATIPLSKDPPAALAFDGSRAWVQTVGGRIVRLDTTRNVIVGSGRKVGVPGQLVFHEGSLWVSTEAGVARLDPETLASKGEIEFAAAGVTYGFAFTPGRIWVASAPPTRGEHGTLHSYDLRTGEPAGTPLTLPYGSPWVAATGDTVWVGAREGGTVTRVDARTAESKTTLVGAEAVYFRSADEDVAWIPTALGGKSLVRVGPGGLEQVVQLGGIPFWSQQVGDDVWVEDYLPPRLRRVEATSGEIIGEPLPVPQPGSIESGVGDLWLLNKTEIVRIRATDPDPKVVPALMTPEGDLESGPVPSGRRLHAGGFAVDLSLEVPSEDWLYAGPSSQLLGLVSRRLTFSPASLDAIAPSAVFGAKGDLVPVKSAEDVLRVFRSRADLSVKDLPSGSIDGLPARRIRLTSIADKPTKQFCATPCSVLYALADGVTIDLTTGESLNLAVVTVGDKPLIVSYEAGDPGDARYRSDAQKIIDSIRFTASSS